MTSIEKEQLISIINSKIESVKADIEELQELIKPIPLDASIGRISRMDAINNKTINEASLREKKKILQRLNFSKVESILFLLYWCKLNFGKVKPWNYFQIIITTFIIEEITKRSYFTQARIMNFFSLNIDSIVSMYLKRMPFV